MTQVDKKANWLKGNRQGSNFEIPGQVNTIVSVIVTPFVEYIWTDNSKLWLDGKIPRICTFEELVEAIPQLPSMNLSFKKYMKYIV